MQKEESVQGEQLAVPLNDDARRKKLDFTPKSARFVWHVA
jgi:hypothetical protein